MRLRHLRTGMRVVTRDGQDHLVVQDTYAGTSLLSQALTFLCMGKNDFIHGISYREDMTNQYHSSLDIQEVWITTRHIDLTLPHIDDQTLLPLCEPGGFICIWTSHIGDTMEGLPWQAPTAQEDIEDAI